MLYHKPEHASIKMKALNVKHSIWATDFTALCSHTKNNSNKENETKNAHAPMDCQSYLNPIKNQVERKWNDGNFRKWISRSTDCCCMLLIVN